jgi:hypothetical protein
MRFSVKHPVFLSIMILFVPFFITAQTTISLDEAVQRGAAYLQNRFPRGTRAAALPGKSENSEIAKSVNRKINSALLNGGWFVMVTRDDEVLESINKEMERHLNFEVSQETELGIGQQLGAQINILTALNRSGQTWRLDIEAVWIESAQLAGQWSAENILSDPAWASLSPVRTKPQWIDEPLTARANYEKDRSGVSAWYYDVGFSNRAASEQLARTRARQNVQQVISENIASDMKSRIDFSSLSLFRLSGIEDAETRIASALTNSIRTRVPSYETLEWYIESGKTNGQEWYMAYVLVRFPRQDIISAVEKLEPERVADTVITQGDEWRELAQQLMVARDNALELLRGGLTGR